MENSAKKPRLSTSQKAGYIIGLIALPILLAFAYFGQLERGLAVASLVAVFLGVAYIKRNLLKNWSFIIIIIFLFAAQLWFVLQSVVPKEHFTGYVAVLAGLADALFLLVVAYIIEKISKPPLGNRDQ